MCVDQRHLSFTSATAEGSTRTVSSTKDPTERGDSRLKTQDSRLKEREEDARGPYPHGGPAPTGRRKRKPPAGRAKAGVAPSGSTPNAGARRLLHRSNLKFCRFFANFFAKISGFSRIFAKFC